MQDRFLNRELSQIDFNARVLALAEDDSAKLLERAKFLAIYATNTDEFYQVRVAGLKQQAAVGIRARSADGLTPQEQLSAIAAKVVPLAERHAAIFADSVMPALQEAGVRVLRWAELDKPQREELNRMFREKIFPVLTPLAVDAGRPFPYISNLSLNLAVLVRDPAAGRMHFARDQGAAASAPLRLVLRGPLLRAARGRDRREPRPALPRHGDRRAAHLPGHAERRPRDRRPRRRPAGGARGGAHEAALQPGRPARGRADDAQSRARAADDASSR